MPSLPPAKGPQVSGALPFDPDPAGLLPGIGSHSGLRMVLRFRVQRARDLVNLQVSAIDCELVRGEAGPMLQPTSANARLEVRLPFQHVGERSFLDTETPDPAPIQARAAYGSRLAFRVPEGTQIAYDVAGFLAALSRLPLLVAPLALPAEEQTAASDGIRVTLLPDGLELIRLGGSFLIREVARRGPEPGPQPLRARATKLGASFDHALSLRRARAALGGAAPLDLSGRAPKDLGVSRRKPPGRPQRLPTPRAPHPDETCIEAPFRLLMSPSAEGAWAHATTPVEAPDGRVELWHSRLGVRTTEGGVDESASGQRIVRALWARDKDRSDPVPFQMPMDGEDRTTLVTQTSDPRAAVRPRPVSVHKLHLSALGAWLDLHGRWPKGDNGISPAIASWDHVAPMGRDQFVKLVYPGYLFPFGHGAALVKQTERRIDGDADPTAYLNTQYFLVVSEPERHYADPKMPFTRIRVLPLCSPSLANPDSVGLEGYGRRLFFPTLAADGQQFRFLLECTDQDGRSVRLHTPLLFVGEFASDAAPDVNPIVLPEPEHVVGAWNDLPIAGDGQHIALVPSLTPGETAMETWSLRFTGVPAVSPALNSTPAFVDADVVLPAVQRLAPPGAPQLTTVELDDSYISHGFGGANAVLQRFLKLSQPVGVDFTAASDVGGGFLAPNLSVQGVTRALGAVGDPAAYGAAGFDPKNLSGLLPKLFGLFDLSELLSAAADFVGAPRFVSAALDQVAALLADLATLETVLPATLARLEADDAAAPTAGIQQAAHAARAALDGPVTGVVDRAKALVDAVTGLQAPSAPRDPTEIGLAITAAATALRADLDALDSALAAAAVPAAVRSAIAGPLAAVRPALGDLGALAHAVASFVSGLNPAGLAQRASYTWEAALHNWPDGPDKDALFVAPKTRLSLAVDVRPSGADAGLSVRAELSAFALNLFPGAPLVHLTFDRIAFTAGSGRKADVDVVFTGLEFQGPLSFVDTLRSMIPFDGFSDPPYLDVSAEGLKAGFDLALPSVGVGVFSLENISLHAGFNVPFLGDALTVDFAFCTREKPFRLTVMMIGGGGFFGMTLSPKGLVVLEMALEAGASLSVDLGVASGSVSVMVGVYLKLESEKGSLTGYFRIRGEVDVLGLISASITLELSLTYDFPTGKLIGRASIDIEVEIFLLSFTVSVSCERRLAGSNGDPTYAQLIDVDPVTGSAPAWDAYCAAFAAA